MAGSSTLSTYGEATILFADIEGFGALARERGPDEAYLVVTRCLRVLDDIARRHGGAVDKYLGDCLMAVFGLPMPLADAPAAAARAALQMRQSVREISDQLALPVRLDLRAGLERGRVLAGALGESVVREFSVLGSAVNRAARIKGLAPTGRIYAGEEVGRHLGEGFRTRPIGDVKLQGLRGAARPVELLAERKGQASVFGAGVACFAPFTGRELELERIDERLGRLRAGTGGVVVIEGAAGVGKSRLVVELAARHSDVPFRPFREDSPADAGSPVVLVVDDFERRAASERAALAAAVTAAASAPTLFLLVGRPPLASEAASLLAGSGASGDEPLTLRLQRLSDAAIDALVAALPDRSLEDDTRALVVERAVGNPARAIQSAFLSEALRADAARADEHADRADEAERRRATVLFADLTGFTALAEELPADELHPLVNACLDDLTSIARHHGGTVEKYLGDCIMAVFGVPTSVEDAPRAAVNAGIEMRQRVAHFNEERALAHPFGVHIGVDTGLGLAGDVSGPLVREYSLMGEAVSGAARLEDLSPSGSIYVGAETWRATRDEFDYVVVAADDGVSTWELRSDSPRVHRERKRPVSSPLVGRARELDTLNASTESLMAGRGGAVALVAEAGLGKSRLLAEALVAPAEGCRWLKGRSLPTGRNLGHHPFADLLARWCGAGDEEDEAAVAAKLSETARAELGPEADEIRPFLATLMGVPLPDSERKRIARLSPDALEPLMLGAMTRMLQRVARAQPLALVFEDLHWADLSSIELLTNLLRLAQSEPILFVLLARPGWADTADRVRAAAHERLGDRYREVPLAPLPSEASRELLRHLFRGADVPFTLREAIEERAGGNPFYVEEVVRGLRDSGALEERAGRLVATPRIHEAEVPGTLQEVVMARIDRLDRRRCELLRVAAAIGGSFTIDVLGDVAGGDDVAQLIASLEEAELVERRERRPGELLFKHPLVHEVVYDSMLAPRRRDLHGRIGAALEARLNEGTPGRHAMLAHHFGRAGDVERAETYLFRAGDEAAQSAASDEALRFFEDAAALYHERHGDDADPEQRGVLERSIAFALMNRGRYVEAIEHFDDALRCRGVDVTDHPVRLGLRLGRDLALVLGRLYLRGDGHPSRAATEAEQAIQELIYERARAQTTNATDRYLFDWMDGLRRLGGVDPRTLPLAGGQFASTVGIFSFGGVSFTISERFLAHARELVDPADSEERMIYGLMTATHATLVGDWSEAHELPDDFIEERIRDGQLFDVTNYLGLRTERRLLQGRFQEAEQGLTRLSEIAELFQFDQAFATVRALRTFLLLEQERWAEAVEAADLHFAEHPDPLPNLLALGNKAKAQILLGDREGAERSLVSAEALLADAAAVVPPFHKSGPWRSRLLFEVDALARGEGQRARARKAARRALRAARWVAPRRAEIFRLEATRRSLSGDGRGARQWWERSLEVARGLGLAPEVERIERDRAG